MARSRQVCGLTECQLKKRMTDQASQVSSQHRVVAFWLFGMAIMVFAMVILGGVTRLTDSGLSMVEWRPVTGWLPPLDDAEWRRIFENYRQTPEYLKINAGMTVAEFKGIFWLEFLHRLWGRMIGIAFFIPFVFFFIKGWVRGRCALSLFCLLLLGGLQGGMGWFMVKSGLVDRPDVSQYRLAAHLILAMIIYSWLIWCGLRYLNGPTRIAENVGRLRAFSRLLVGLVFATSFTGALVAGLDAGLSYNTFPLMDGELIPDGLLEMQPVYLNFFENHMTAQFDHRILAMFTFVMIVVFWVLACRKSLSSTCVRCVHGLMFVACAQVGLGITTLLLVVPLGFAAMHQAGAVLLLGFATAVAFAMQGACKDYALKSS